MKPIWQYNFWYWFWRHYVDFCTKVSFSSLEVSGLERIPKNAAVMLAPNHRCALMDALLVLLLTDRSKDAIGFGARSDIFRNPKIAAILRWLRILPIARERNGREEIEKNIPVLDEIVDCMGHKVPFCLFSEGTHRAERGMMPVRKGIFRVTKLAHDRFNEPVYIVPVGLDFEYFFRQTGRARVAVGEPFEIGEFYSRYQGEPDAHIQKELCAELQKRILALLDNMPARQPAPMLLRAVAALLALPVFAVTAVCAAPIRLTAWFLLRRMKDKAWAHTVYFGCRLLMPLFIPFEWLYSLILNYYYRLITDLRK